MWTLGTLIWCPLAAVMFGCLAVLAVIVLRVGVRDRYMRDVAFTGAGLLAAGALAVLVGTVFGMWPFRAEYHQWRVTSGTIAVIKSRLIPSGDGSMQQRFVVRYTDGRQRSCDDSRCALLAPGDPLTLRCKRAYQWGATPGWDCNYVSGGKESDQ